MIPAIETEKLDKVLNDQRVLQQVDLRIDLGEIVVIRGSNGAGKTTLLRCLAGLLRPTSGLVRWFGASLMEHANGERPIGLVGHESFLYPELTAGENLLLAARLQRVAEPHQCVAGWLERARLQRASTRPVEQLSRGMRQRLAIARSLLHEPPIALLDEPFSGLDDESCRWLSTMLRGLRERNRAICLACHDEQQSSPLADRIVRLEQGRCDTGRTEGQSR